MNTGETVRFMKESVALFADFDEERLLDLVEGSRLVTFEPGEAVIEFGEEVLFLGILLDGEAEASMRDDAGDKHVLVRLEAGDVFGEMALMTGDKSVADVMGVTRCKALLLPQSLFAQSIATNPSAIACLSRTIVERVKASASLGAPEDELASAALHGSDDPYGFRLRTEHPMKILVVNCGSSSLKYNVFDTANEKGNAEGIVERIGDEGTCHAYRSDKGEWQRDLPGAGHGEAFAAMVQALTDETGGALRSASEVTAVGHRVVHGGAKYSHQAIIDNDVIEEIEKAAVFAPLHNPVNLIGIREARRLFPKAAHVAVFDTAFHQVMPSYAYLYGLPYEYFERDGIRRYGFHGTSHKYVSLKVAEYLERPFNELETIVCHLGNGASVCAVDHGRSVDTSMGFTPAEGLLMGTRCGDLDPAILVHLMRTEGLGPEKLDDLINKQSGLKGLSGVSGDMREVEAAAAAGNHRALLALKTFSYRVRKYIGAYMAAMGGVNAVAFTGGIGQGSAGMRSVACQGLGQMGIRIDEERNRQADGFDSISDITEEGAVVRVLVVPTDEERMIARETLRALSRSHVAEILHSQAAIPIPLEVSAHHIHLSQEHVDALFGEGHALTPLQELSQPGQFACKERVRLVGPKGAVDKVRILGPTRKETQVEIAMTEQFKLGIHPPLRESGVLDGTPGLTLEGPAKSLTLDHGVICALRHIHMTPEDALRMGLRDKDVVTVRVEGDRELTFGDVLVRVSPNYRLAMHIDTDEGNAAHIEGVINGYIEGIQSRW